MVWDVQSGKLQYTFPLGNGDISFSPDSQKFLIKHFEKPDPHLVCRDMATGKEAFTIKLAAADRYDLIWSPDAQRLVINHFEKAAPHVVCWEATTGKTIFSIRLASAESYRLIFSPDAQKLLINHFDKAAPQVVCSGRGDG